MERDRSSRWLAPSSHVDAPTLSERAALLSDVSVVDLSLLRKPGSALPVEVDNRESTLDGTRTCRLSRRRFVASEIFLESAGSNEGNLVRHSTDRNVTYVFARCSFSGVALALSSPLVSILLISSVNLVVSLAPYVRRSDTEPRYIRTILVRHSISHRSKSPKSLVIFQRGLSRRLATRATINVAPPVFSGLIVELATCRLTKVRPPDSGA